jgi:hypothetical protein
MTLARVDLLIEKYEAPEFFRLDHIEDPLQGDWVRAVVSSVPWSIVWRLIR